MPNHESFQQQNNSPRPRKPAPRRPEQRERSDDTSRRPQNQRGGNRWFRAMILVVGTLALCVFMALFVLQTINDVFGFEQPDNAIEVVIPEDSTIGEVAQVLKESGVIDNAMAFRLYSGLKAEDGDFAGGTYMFNANKSYDELIVALKRGTEKEVVTLYFVEGRTVAEIARLLEQYEVCAADEFLDYLDSVEYDYEFFNAIPNDEHRFRKLEGYVFPDTYDFYVGENVADVARKFVSNFNQKITEEMEQRMMELNLTLDETIILASIIQKEAGEVEDMRMVSGVFHNRLALSETFPNLQSDVTILYVNDNIKPYLQEADQDMYDAYNTYECVGLPVGAISNPGMDAIEAALYPEESEYYYFVTDRDEKFYYASTLQEHNQNIAIAKSVGGNTHGVATQ